jgi:hypothetical protein
VSRATWLPPALCSRRGRFGGHPIGILRRRGRLRLGFRLGLDGGARGDVLIARGVRPWPQSSTRAGVSRLSPETLAARPSQQRADARASTPTQLLCPEAAASARAPACRPLRLSDGRGGTSSQSRRVRRPHQRVGRAVVAVSSWMDSSSRNACPVRRAERRGRRRHRSVMRPMCCAR